MAKVDIQKSENGYFINDKLFFTTSGSIKKDYINLVQQIGKKTDVWKKDIFKVDYPGEYDKDGVYIKVYENDGDLNFVIRYDNKKIALIQSSDIIENVEIDNVDIWIFNNSDVGNSLDKLEIEGKQQNLNKLE